jgi:hypothetical protein
MKLVGRYKVFRAAAALALAFLMCGLAFEGSQIGKELSSERSIVNADRSLSELVRKTSHAPLGNFAVPLLFSKQCEANDFFAKLDSTVLFSKQCDTDFSPYEQYGTNKDFDQVGSTLLFSKQCEATSIASKQSEFLRTAVAGLQLQPILLLQQPIALA